MVFKFHITMVLPKCFIGLGSSTTSAEALAHVVVPAG